jgi:hypothetical protein
MGTSTLHAARSSISTFTASILPFRGSRRPSRPPVLVAPQAPGSRPVTATTAAAGSKPTATFQVHERTFCAREPCKGGDDEDATDRHGQGRRDRTTRCACKITPEAKSDTPPTVLPRRFKASTTVWGTCTPSTPASPRRAICLSPQERSGRPFPRAFRQ